MNEKNSENGAQQLCRKGQGKGPLHQARWLKCLCAAPTGEAEAKNRGRSMCYCVRHQEIRIPANVECRRAGEAAGAVDISRRLLQTYRGRDARQ